MFFLKDFSSYIICDSNEHRFNLLSTLTVYSMHVIMHVLIFHQQIKRMCSQIVILTGANPLEYNNHLFKYRVNWLDS